jgi:hypothetical protein
MKTITITWKAFGNPTSKTIQYETNHDVWALSDEAVFSTNTYSGDLWEALQPLPENRTHTALSVGDELVIDGFTRQLAGVGYHNISATCARCDEVVTDWNHAPIGTNKTKTKRIFDHDTFLCDECYDHWCTKYDIQPLEGE